MSNAEVNEREFERERIKVYVEQDTLLELLAVFLPVVEAAHRHRPPNMEKPECKLCEQRRYARAILEAKGMAPPRHMPGGDWRWAGE